MIESGFVQTSHDEAAPVTSKSTVSGYTNYDFRTTFGTQLKESGQTSAIVADLMGHADTRMVETVYARTRHEGVMKQLHAIQCLNEQLS